jgi:hypothetical protein
MAKSKAKSYPKVVLDLMAEKTETLSKAQALMEMGMPQMGMPEIVMPLWASAASQEERVAPLLEILGRNVEAAVHRISAASCYRKAGDLSRAINLYRAALAGPLREDTRQEVQQMLKDCLDELARSTFGEGLPRRARKVATGA